MHVLLLWRLDWCNLHSEGLLLELLLQQRWVCGRQSCRWLLLLLQPRNLSLEPRKLFLALRNLLLESRNLRPAPWNLPLQPWILSLELRNLLPESRNLVLAVLAPANLAEPQTQNPIPRNLVPAHGALGFAPGGW